MQDDEVLNLGNELSDTEDQEPIRLQFESEDETIIHDSEEDNHELQDEIFACRSVFGKANLPKLDVIASVLGLKVRYNLSDEATLGIFQLINNLETPPGSEPCKEFPNSRYGLNKVMELCKAIKPEYTHICSSCYQMLEKSDSKKASFSRCPKKKCRARFVGANSNEPLSFVTVGIQEQIESYLKQDKFRSMIFSGTQNQRGLISGTMHQGIIRKGDFDMFFCMDACPLYKRTNDCILPAVLFFNNLPVSYQTKYPIIAGLFVGPSQRKPPRQIFLQAMEQDFQRLGKTGIKWTSASGKEFDSKVFLTVCGSDAQEKCIILNHVGPTGYFSCPFCIMKGVSIGPDNFKEVFDPNNIFRRSAANVPKKQTEAGKQPPQKKTTARYPVLLSEVGDDHRVRTSQSRLTMGEKVEKWNKNKTPYNTQHTDGIKGLPVLFGLPNFNCNDSHTAGILHVVAEGILKDILTFMFHERYKGYKFNLLTKDKDWKRIEDIQDSLTRVTECNHNAQNPTKFKMWVGRDYYEFLNHQSAAVCSDEDAYDCNEIHEIMVSLSNAIWYSCLSHSDTSEEAKQLAYDHIQAFCRKVRAFFKEDWMTHKLHILQHFPEIMRRHGPAFFWDDWNMERLNNWLKNLITTNWNAMDQCVRNLILKHHATVFQDMKKLQRSTVAFLKRQGLEVNEWLGLGDFILQRKSEENPRMLNARIVQQLQAFLQQNNLQHLNNESYHRITRMSHRSVQVLTSNQFCHRGKVRDNLISIDTDFGQIEDILHFYQSGKIIFIMKKFKKIPEVRNSIGMPIIYPVNQFPYQETEDYVIFESKDSTVIRKAQTLTMSYINGDAYNFFTIRPNEYLRE